jgi:HlyD family secretion protein
VRTTRCLPKIAAVAVAGACIIDIPRKISRWPGRLKLGSAIGGGLVLLFIAQSQLSARLRTTTLDARDVVISEVRRDTLIRDVRAAGVLVPTELRWITARAEGQVERILVEAGTYVHADTVILELSNPALARDVDTARIELEAQQAQALVLEKRAMNDLLAQQAQVAEYVSNYENARFRLEANQALGDLVSRVDLNESMLQASQLQDRVAIEQRRLVHLGELQSAEVHANSVQIARLERQLQLQQELLQGLTVRAGIEGILQEVPVEPGQLLASGTPLARVAREDNFKTALRVQEGQAKEIRAGQSVIISAGGQHAKGKVTRIDPAVQEGTVLVDVAFVGDMLIGARPDLRVQGIVEIDRVEDALVMARPVFSEENGTRELFVVNVDGGEAHRQSVTFGMGSVDEIQILNGLDEGSNVIVSDMENHRDRQSVLLKGASR